MDLTVRAVGIAWYRREDYAKIRKIMKDRHKLSETYDQWLKRADRTFQDYQGQGYIVEKVNIDPDAFPAWCASRGLNIDAHARMTFANEFVAGKYRNQS